MAKAKYKEKDDGPRRPEPVKRDGAYVMMLFITLVAIVTGCVLMHLDHDEYSSKASPPPPGLTIQKLGDANKTEAPAGAAPTAPPVAPPAVPPVPAMP